MNNVEVYGGMKRLTRRDTIEGVKAVWYGDSVCYLEGDTGYAEADKLAFYEDLDEQGRLIDKELMLEHFQGTVETIEFIGEVCKDANWGDITTEEAIKKINKKLVFGEHVKSIGQLKILLDQLAEQYWDERYPIWKK